MLVSKMPHKRDDAALEVERRLTVGPLVDQPDPQRAGKIGNFAEPLGQDLVVVVETVREDRRIGHEGRGGSMLGGIARSDNFDLTQRDAPLVDLPVDLPVAAHLNATPL